MWEVVVIKTLLVVEVLFYREGLAELLGKSGIVEVVAAANDVETAERFARSVRPQVALIDVSMADAAEAIQRIRVLPSPPKFVALAINTSSDAVLRWAELGAAAFVPRNATLEDLLHIILGVAQDELYCSPAIAAKLLGHVAQLASTAHREVNAMVDLSQREREVLSLLARGMPNKAIANALAISNATAKNHVHNILEKLRLHRRSEVAALLKDSPRRLLQSA
jgi:DNA-binding NarL/FixJ family response regulator